MDVVNTRDVETEQTSPFLRRCSMLHVEGIDLCIASETPIDSFQSSDT